MESKWFCLFLLSALLSPFKAEFPSDSDNEDLRKAAVEKGKLQWDLLQSKTKVSRVCIDSHAMELRRAGSGEFHDSRSIPLIPLSHNSILPRNLFLFLFPISIRCRVTGHVGKRR